MLRRTLSVLALTALLAMGAQAALAHVSYTATLASGKTTLVTTSGVIYKGSWNGGDSINAKMYVVDKSANGYPVYGRANWAFNGTYCYAAGGEYPTVGCTSGWYGAGRSDTPSTYTSGTWYKGHELELTANSARAAVQACESQAWYDPDDCSGNRFGGFSY